MKHKKINILKIFISFSLAFVPFGSLLISTYTQGRSSFNSFSDVDGIAKIYFEDARNEFLELSNIYSAKLFDDYNKVGEGIVRKLTPVVQNRLYQNSASNYNWKIDERMNLNIDFSSLKDNKFNKPIFLNQSIKCDNQQELKGLLGPVTQSIEPTSKAWKYINLINLSGRGNTIWINVFNEFWNGGYNNLMKSWVDITSHYDAKNVGVNGQYLTTNRIDSNKNIGQWNIHWPTKNIDPSTLIDGKVASQSELKLQFKNSTGDGNWKDASDVNDEWCKIHGIKNMPKEAWQHVLPDTGYFVFFGGSGLPSQKVAAIHNLQFLDGYGGKGHDVWNPIYYSLGDLFEISDIGYDKDKGYYYILNYNEKLLLAAIAIHGNKGLSELLKKEFDNNEIKCLLNDINYFDFKLNKQKKEFNGGKSSWIDKNSLIPSIRDNYDVLMNDLYKNLDHFLKANQLSYDNYFVVKGLINKYSQEKRVVPDFNYLNEQFENNALWQNNGWDTWTTKYGVTDNTLKVLLTILPQLKISQWSMSNSDPIAGSYTNGCWTNPTQKMNVGTKQTTTGEVISYSEFQELIQNGNKVYINEKDLNPANIEFRTNVGVKRDVQDLNKFEVSDQDIHLTDEAGVYFPTNINNIDILNKKTFGSVDVNHKAKDTIASKQRTIDSLKLEKNISKVVAVNDYFPNIKIEPKEKYASLSPSQAISTANGETTAKKLQEIFKDQINKDISPFIKIDVYNDTYTFDLPNEMLEIIPDDTNGQMQVRLFSTDKTILETATIGGFKNEVTPVDPDVPTDQKGLSTGAIAGIAMGSIVGTAGIAATATLIIKKRKPNINKKSKIKGL